MTRQPLRAPQQEMNGAQLTGNHEQIREIRHTNAQITRRPAIVRPLGPMFLQRLPAAPLDRHPSIIPINRIEPRRENDHIQLMYLPVRGLEPILRERGDGSLLDVDDVDAVAVELLVVAAVAEWSAGVEVVRGQFASFLGVLDRLRDLGADELAGFFVGFFGRGQVREGPEHEPEAVSHVPSGRGD